MRKTTLVLLAMALFPCAFAVDGVVLINQSTVAAAGGFPYKITQSGSYRLSGNLTVPDANTTAISIAADNVTIDLNGFSIIGPTVCTGSPSVTSCSPTGTGIGVDGGSHNSITVVNGSVRGMGSGGISLQGIGSLVEKVHADSNRFFGISGNGTFTSNTASGNGNNGIETNPLIGGNTISGNTTRNNGSAGINVACPSSVVGNTSVSNGSGNLATFGAGCAVANNAAP